MAMYIHGYVYPCYIYITIYKAKYIILDVFCVDPNLSIYYSY